MKSEIKRQIDRFPRTRFMGSKQKLLKFIYENIKGIKSDRALDAFSGSCAVGYLLKAMGYKIDTNDFLKFSYHISNATIENNEVVLNKRDIEQLLKVNKNKKSFISKNFKDLYFTDEENRFLDQTYANIMQIFNEYKQSIALTALARACVKKRPRGIFTYTGMRYNDGRRDLKITIQQQFLESINLINSCVFNNGRKNKSYNMDIFSMANKNYDLVYIDPPYYSLHSDNDYSRRYHFIEGLMTYWTHVKINPSTKTKKFNNIYTPFQSKIKVYDAFEKIFKKFEKSTLVVSYSSNSLPTFQEMESILKKYKSKVKIAEYDYKYSFGTQRTDLKRNMVKEYLFIGND